jgi:hypothetical protein
MNKPNGSARNPIARLLESDWVANICLTATGLWLALHGQDLAGFFHGF